MPSLRIQVWWDNVSYKSIALEHELTINDVIESIRKQVGNALPEEDGHNHVIEYTLYRRDEQNTRVALWRRLPLRKANLQIDEQLYLANRKAPWWEAAPTGKRPSRPIIASSPAPSVSIPIRCRLQLTPGYIITMPPDGLHIDRAYLMQSLPWLIAIRERARIFLGQSSRLLRVSRDKHCSFFHNELGWMLHIHKPTYMNGIQLSIGTQTILADATTIILGTEGWPIKVHLDTQ